MNTPTIISERITTPFPTSGERMKGGEKRMASEWEDLMALSKEELVIEIVKERNTRRIIDWKLRSIVEVES